MDIQNWVECNVGFTLATPPCLERVSYMYSNILCTWCFVIHSGINGYSRAIKAISIFEVLYVILQTLYLATMLKLFKPVVYHLEFTQILVEKKGCHMCICGPKLTEDGQK